MKITHTKDWNEHRVSITHDLSCGKYEYELSLVGRGETKHAAIQSAIESIESIGKSVETYRKEITNL